MAVALMFPLALLAGCSDPGSQVSTTQLIDANVKPEDRLFRALEKQNLQEVEQALLEGVDPNGTGTGKQTPLEFAATRGYVEGGKVLLAHRAEINRRPILRGRAEDGKIVERPGNAPLHVAVAAYQVDFAKMLIENNAEVNILNGLDLTPLDMAKGSEELLREMVEGTGGTPRPSEERLAMISEQRGKITALIALLEQHGGRTSKDSEDTNLDNIKSGGIIKAVDDEMRQNPLLRDRKRERDASEEDGTKPSSSRKSRKRELPPLEPLP